MELLNWFSPKYWLALFSVCVMTNVKSALPSTETINFVSGNHSPHPPSIVVLNRSFFCHLLFTVSNLLDCLLWGKVGFMSCDQLSWQQSPLQCYSLAVIGCRLITFNDCEEASRELQQVGVAKQQLKRTVMDVMPITHTMQEVKEARRDLEAKGLKF